MIAELHLLEGGIQFPLCLEHPHPSSLPNLVPPGRTSGKSEGEFVSLLFNRVKAKGM